MPFSDLKELASNVNKLGKKFKNPYEQFMYDGININKSGRTDIIIFCKKRNERKSVRYCKIRKGSNPFLLNRGYPTSYIQELVNGFGKVSTNPYEQFTFVEKMESGFCNKFKVKIYCKKRNETKICEFGSLTKGSNPFNVLICIPNDYIIKNINALGQISDRNDEKFFFVKKIDEGSNFKVCIENVETKEQKVAEYHSLKSGRNPFNKTQNRIEANQVQPLVMEILTSMGFKSIIKEYTLSINSRPDFLCELPNGDFLIVEVKAESDYNKLHKNMMQVNKYKKEGAQKFGSKFIGVVLVSPNGTNGCQSIKNLKSILKSYF